MARLSKNQIVKTIDGDDVVLLEKLGEGGQGFVYKVKYKNEKYALKWYKRAESESFYENLKSNVEHGSPASSFLWPLAITQRDYDGCFGYIMKLRPSEYKEFSLFLVNQEKFLGFQAIVNAALQIAVSFRLLHSSGLSYQDLNDGNFFINPNTGDVLICDNDNVAPNGDNLGILGKPRYIAPEVVEQTNKPDTYSDRFSLAIILFLLFFRNHPLEGLRDNCDDDNNEKNLFCKNPIFVFDEDDESNRPNPAIHRNVNLLWPIFPPFVQKIFKDAFSKSVMRFDGLNREDRPMEKDWIKVLIKLKQSIIFCPNCNEETFFNMKKDTNKCMCCGNVVNRPVRLNVNNATIPLQPQLKIHKYEIDNSSEINVESIKDVYGEIIENKKQVGVWGLKNKSNITWYRNSPGGKEFVCKSNEVITIVRNNIVKFGTLCEGSID